MSEVMCWVITVGVWLTGAIAFYVADDYFDFGFSESYDKSAPIAVCVFWPFSIWFYIAIGLNNWSRALRKKRDTTKASQERIRVAKQAEMEKLLQDSESEMERFVAELQRKDSR